MLKAMVPMPMSMASRKASEDGKLPPMAGVLIGGGISMMFWGVVILIVFA